MRLGTRVVLFILLASVAPLVMMALAAGSIASQHLADNVAKGQAQVADSIALSVARVMADADRVLRAQMGNFRLDGAPDEARTGFVVATYRLFPEISIATLIDASGQEIVPPIYRSPDEKTWVEGHDAVLPDQVRRFRKALPPRPAPGTSAMGTPYLPDGAKAAVVPMTFASPYDDGLALGVQLSLDSVRRRMEVSAEGDRFIMLFAPDGTRLAWAGRAEAVDPARFKPFLEAPSANIAFDDVDVVAATSRVPNFDWVVAVAEPASVVRSAQRALLRPTWYTGGVALVFALAAGLLLSRSVTVPIRRLHDAATALGQGDLSRRVEVEGRDELADLGQAFNQMSAALETSTHEIAEKNEEIRAFNRELQARVEQRTAQLREAQSRLVQSGQLAAVAEMSAGLAHELNNPLAGVLGMVQLVAAKRAGTSDEVLLRAAEEQAVRCKEIVANLLRYTEAPANAPSDERSVVDLNTIVTEVLELVTPALRQRGVTAERTVTSEALWVRGNTAQLGRALSQMLTAMKGLAEPGATIRIEGGVTQGQVEMSFAVGATVRSQDDWKAAGMSFWVARQVLGAHGFTLDEPETGGREWRIRAPLQAAPG